MAARGPDSYPGEVAEIFVWMSLFLPAIGQ